MRYIDRRFLFPVVAASAWAQQQSPEAAAAEAAVRARAQEFFDLQVAKKYRQAEAMVAEDTRDLYYNGPKSNIKDFSIQSIELSDNNTRARVTIRTKVTVSVPTAGPMDFDLAQTTLWKLENGQWAWYVEQRDAPTPFGIMHQSHDGDTPTSSSIPHTGPDASTLQQMVKVDRNTVVLTAEEPRQTVTVTNELPGGVDLELRNNQAAGFKAEMAKKHLQAGENTPIEFTATGGAAGESVVQVLVSPLNSVLEIKVTRK